MVLKENLSANGNPMFAFVQILNCLTFETQKLAIVRAFIYWVYSSISIKINMNIFSWNITIKLLHYHALPISLVILCAQRII